MPKKQIESNLVTALKFISLAQRDSNNNPFKEYCQLSNGFVTSCDGILTASHKIEEDLEARPHTAKFIAALNNCGKNLSITQLENTLVVRSGRYSAKVPCHDAETAKFEPDQPQVAISDVLKTAFSAIQHLANDAGTSVHESSILIKSGSMIATNGSTALEYWHGLDLPTIAVPKSFTMSICKIKKPLISAGFSNSTATFWFEDESWVKTQLFVDAWPDVAAAFNMPNLPILELPKSFYKALGAVEEFAEDGREKGFVRISEQGISSHKDVDDGAFFELPGLGALTVGIRQLKHIENSCKTLAFGEYRIYFFDDNVRGVLKGIKD